MSTWGHAEYTRQSHRSQGFSAAASTANQFDAWGGVEVVAPYRTGRTMLVRESSTSEGSMPQHNNNTSTHAYKYCYLDDHRLDVALNRHPHPYRGSTTPIGYQINFTNHFPRCRAVVYFYRKQHVLLQVACPVVVSAQFGISAKL